jgi:hypothetical protein
VTLGPGRLEKNCDRMCSIVQLMLLMAV